ncbi:MAG: HRDC domain-containing protein [Pseudomonadota bacterium]
MSQPQRYIDRAETLDTAAADWRDPIAFDTEFMRTNTFFPIPGLYQLATQRESALIDPVAIDDLAPLRTRLATDEWVVMHACSEDLELLHHHLLVTPPRLFDTQVANAFLTDRYAISYAGLVEERLGVSLDKGATRSNWVKRPLSTRQLAYAHADVAYLLELFDRLRAELEQRGALDWCLEELAERTRFEPTEPQRYYLSISGAWRLEDTELAALRDLTAWRERQARAEDVPRNKVVADDVLLELARHARLSRRDVHAHLQARAAERYAEELLETHRFGRAATTAPERPPKPLTSAEQKQVKSLRDVARARAESLGMAPELLARKRDIETLVRAQRDEPDSLHHYGNWRAQALGEPFARAAGITERGA